MYFLITTEIIHINKSLVLYKSKTMVELIRDGEWVALKLFLSKHNFFSIIVGLSI